MNEKTIIKKRDELRYKLESNISDFENERIAKIAFYENFEIVKQTDKNMGFSENEVFIANREVIEDGHTIRYYELYDETGSLLGYTDKEGKIQYTDEYLTIIKQRTGKFYNELDIEGREHYLHIGNEFSVLDKPYENLNEIEKKELEETEQTKNKSSLNAIEPAMVEDELGLDRYDIRYSVEITDKKFYDNVPSAKNYDGNAMLIYSEKLGKYLVGGMEDGKFKINEDVMPSQKTDKASINLDHDGTDIEKDNMYAIMEIKGNPNYAYSIDIEAHGFVEFQELRVDRTKMLPEYVSQDLETSRQYRADYEVRTLMNRDKNLHIHDEVDSFYYEREKEEADPEERDNIDFEDLEEAKEEVEEDLERGYGRPGRRPY